MFEIITLDNSDYWDTIVKSFARYDIYHLSGYSKGFYIHGDGIPLLFYYHDDDIRGICVMMKRDISQNEYFKNKFNNKPININPRKPYLKIIEKGNT